MTQNLKEKIEEIIDEGFCKYYGYFLPGSHKPIKESFAGTYKELVNEISDEIISLFETGRK